MCYTASLSASADIMEEVIGKAIDIDMVDGLPELINALAGEEELTPAAALASSQKILSYSIDMHSAKLLQDMMVDERGKARLNSLAMLRAGDWLNTVPVRALGLHLRPQAADYGSYEGVI